jgi:thiol-disulfide isomerase/thioredoxin
LFINLGDGRFADASGISGADSPADGRSFAWMDADRDGRLDIVEANANAPLLQLFLNDTDRRVRHFAKIRLVGGNHDALPSGEWSNRDAYGARVSIEAGKDGRSRVRSLRAGDGFAAQNSRYIHAGLGTATLMKRVVVDWPSGRQSEHLEVPANKLVTIYENPAQSPSGTGVEIEDRKKVRPALPPAAGRNAETTVLPAALRPAADGPAVRVSSGFATWCTACREELPQIRTLVRTFDPEEVEFVGVPADRFDRDAAVREWTSRYEPPYTMLFDVPKDERDELRKLILETLGRDGLPATFVVDRDGRMLSARFGAPTVSELRRALDARGR